MLLDYKYIKKQRKLSVSYINDKGMKSIIDFNVDKFKSFYDDPQGQFEQPDGKRCSVKYTSDPSPFDIRTFLKELPDNYKKLFSGKVSPKLYTFDIETKLRDDREFEEPCDAGMPIHTISVVSPEMNTVVMGDKILNEEDVDWIQSQIQDYLNKLSFFHTLNLELPTFKYQYYDSEKDMLEYFLKGIVSKVPILSGWNNIRYDWQYITNRIKNNYPNLSVTCSSSVYQCTPKKFTDMKGNDFYCPMPLHTPIIDMSQVMDFDLAVMPIKEANSLDYIASETPGLGVHKIEYDGDLEILYERDYRRYVFYNAIDSILVQLINYRYKTLETMYMQALYCEVKIQDTFSKIAVSEALAWNDFYEHGYKIVYEKDFDVQRGQLRGAYVAKPKPGKWNFATCNDYASLYPSTIITCNISFENYIGHYYDEEALKSYRSNPEYIVIGPVVLKNEGSAAKPELGEEIGVFLDDKSLEPFRKDPNYFVSVNGHVYKNDKDYSFKRIQSKLKATRNISKYLGKQLDAKVMLDVEHIMKGRTPSTDPYAKNLVDAMKEMGYDIYSSQDLLNMSSDRLKEFKRVLGTEITFYTCKEQAMKLLGNSMYGGSSHAAFYWFNINLARDITGEARNLIHMMEKYVPNYFDKNWVNMADLHEKLGITVNKNCDNNKLVQVIYGDTDSCASQTMVSTSVDQTSIEEFFNRNNQGEVYITPNGSELVKTDEKVLNYNKNGELEYQPINYIMRHKVSKPKWRLKTKSGKEIIVTADHSLIVFREGKKLEVKPRDVLKTDKILVIV